MTTTNKQTVTVKTQVHAPLHRVWEKWTNPQHIVKWYFASDDWHAPAATNECRPGGTFATTMAAKDGSFSFDFAGTYTHVDQHKELRFVLGDGREVSVKFESGDNKATSVTECFEAESQHPVEFQHQGWQAILDNFKKYVEADSQEMSHRN